MSTNTDDTTPTDTDDEPSIFEQLYEEHKEGIDELCGSDNPGAPLAEVVREEAMGGDDAE